MAPVILLDVISGCCFFSLSTHVLYLLKVFAFHLCVVCLSHTGVENYHLLSHIFRTESVKYNKNYTRAAKRPEVIIQIILTDEVRNI